MALSDYYLCDECGAKTFGDASLSYDDSNTNPDTMHPWPDNVGWMRVLCHDCAEAARSESEDTQRSAASQPVLPGELVEAVQKLIDQARLVNGWADADAYSRLEETGSDFRYSQTCLLTVRCNALQSELNSLAERDPFAEARAQGAADERERLAPHLHTAIAVITEMLEREGISDPETFPPLVEIRAAWLRSQKDTTHDQ
jgi:hypothetical protein